MPDRSCWCMQCLGGRIVFLWEHSVFLLRALGGGEHLPQSARGRGDFRKMLTAAEFVCGAVQACSYTSAFLGKNPSVSGGERLLWV